MRVAFAAVVHAACARYFDAVRRMMPGDRRNARDEARLRSDVAKTIAERTHAAHDHANRCRIDIRTFHKSRTVAFPRRVDRTSVENINDVGFGELLVHECDRAFGFFSDGKDTGSSISAALTKG